MNKNKTTDPKSAARKGERTRTRLISATIELLARLGYRGTSVLEITKTAKVSNGTFYLYFKGKAEILDQAIFQRGESIVRSIYEAERGIDDIVERTAFACRSFVESIMEDALWAKAMLSVHDASPELRRKMNKYMIQTLREGASQGAFRIEGSPLQVECINSVLISTIRMQLGAETGPEGTEECVALVLKMLGVSHDEAEAVANGVCSR